MSFLEKKQAKFLNSISKGVFLSKKRLSTGSTSKPPSPMFLHQLLHEKNINRETYLEPLFRLQFFFHVLLEVVWKP